MTFPVIPKRSSTLMLAVRSHLANQQLSVRYKLLMLQRSSTSRFMPNKYVFPGGVSEKTDFSPEWLDLIGHKGLPLKPTMSDAPFYQSYTMQLSNHSLPAHIGFRICAIRETFEESGILLVKSLQDGNKVKPSAHNVNTMLSKDQILSWREKVHKDSSSFIHLCRHIQCVPDIWSLYEWSNWVTPAYRLQRFDTMFYVAFLDSEPEMSHDGNEVTSSIWINPEESLQGTNRLNIAPPQFYEMSRLCRFSTVDELKTFAMSLKGVESWEAVAVQTSDGGSIYFFPGDDMYGRVKQDTYKHYKSLMQMAAAKDFKQKIPLLKISQTTQQVFVKTDNMNRLVINFKNFEFRLECTAKLKYDMPTPLFWNSKL